MQAAPPFLTIVVASTGRGERLATDLAHAAAHCSREGVELIVAHADTSDGLVELGDACPRARVIGAPRGTGLQELRRLGFRAASGQVVTLIDHTDDHALSHERWMSELRRRCSLQKRRQGAADVAIEAAGMLPRRELSVVVPAHQEAEMLARSLDVLVHSDLPRTRWELIVVDDGSTDDTPCVAARFADVVVRLSGRRHGTAYARNRGFELARGESVVFIDADVRVHPDTLTRFSLVFAREPDVSAVFGSFDTTPAAPGLVSGYRHLLFHYYCRTNCEEPEPLCVSCAAVRSDVFANVGMFDEWHFPRRQLEDVDLAHRLREQGHRVVVRPDIQASHLKRWTLRSMIVADIRDRTVPWVRLRRTKQLARLRVAKTVNSGLAWLAAILVVVALWTTQPMPLFAAAACVAIVMRADARRHRFFVRERGLPFLLAVLPVELLSYLVHGIGLVAGWLVGTLLGEPKPHPAVEAFAEIGVRTWPPVPAPRTNPSPPPPVTTLERPA